jgi:hypothetical protein
MIRTCLIGIGLLVSVPALATCSVADSLIKEYGISFSGFQKPISRIAAQPDDMGHPNDLIRIALPNERGEVSDGFVHSAMLNRTLKRVWILRTGGFASVYEWYGPLAMAELNLTGCDIEPGYLIR